MTKMDLSTLGINLDVVEDESQKGGTKLADLPAGTYGGRLIGVVEMGKHPGFDKTKQDNSFMLVFQLFGKLVPEDKDKDGKPIPRLEFFRMNKTFNESGNFLEVFNLMNYKGTAHNFFQLLGSPYRIIRKEYQKKDGTTGIKLHKDGILKPMIEVLDEDGLGTGQFKEVKVPEATHPLVVFQWDTGTQAQFDTLLPFMQKEIKKALNLAGSPAEKLVSRDTDGGQEAEEVPEEKPSIIQKPINKAAARDEEEFSFE